MRRGISQVFRRCAIFSAALALISAAALQPVRAQEYRGRYALRLGYLLGEGSRWLNGPELSADVPLIRRIPGVGALSFSPSLAFGGALSHGADLDGTVARLLVTLRREIGPPGLYAGLGAGVAGAWPRAGAFSATGAFVQNFHIGYLFPQNAFPRPQPLLEIGYHAAPRAALRGWAFQAGIRF